MRIFILLVITSLSVSSCDLIIKGVHKKAVETVESLEEEEESKPKKKKKDGEHKTYFDDGTLKTKINYKDGRKHGEAISYYQNGKVKISMSYKNGVKHGPSLFYYQNGQLYRESNYDNGQLDGVRKVYKYGKVSSETPYKNGQVGKGLKEFSVKGDLMTGYPKLVFEKKDTRKTDNTYTIYVKFSKSTSKDQFYVGELSDGIFLHDDLYPLFVKDGVGKLPLDIPPDVTGSQIINFIGVHETELGNSYVTSYEYEVVVK